MTVGSQIYDKIKCVIFPVMIPSIFKSNIHVATPYAGALSKDLCGRRKIQLSHKFIPPEASHASNLFYTVRTHHDPTNQKNFGVFITLSYICIIPLSIFNH